MSVGILKFNWSEVENYSEEEITYFLHLEGKSASTISKIRRLDMITVQEHILHGKIKYRFLSKSSNIEELFKSISNAGKDDKISVLQSLPQVYRDRLLFYIKSNYIDFDFKEKEVAVWIIGELNGLSGLDILAKAFVHNSVGIRRMAVSAMGKLNNATCEDYLIRALEDSNAQVALYAVKALTKLKSKKASQKINALIQRHNKDYIQRAVEQYNTEVP